MSSKGVRSILIADDNLGFRDLFCFTFAPLGYEIVAVEDGLEALETIRERAFDLVVLDVHMPRMGGPEALARIRELRPDQRVVVLSTSAESIQSLETRATTHGASACLLKPMDLDTLIGSIERALTAPAIGGPV